MSEYCKRCLQLEEDIRSIFAKRFPSMSYEDTFTALAMLGQDPPQEVPPAAHNSENGEDRGSDYQR